jgi:hypothetical protein
MKKVAFFLLWLFSTCVFSATSGNIVYVDGFESSVDKASNLLQINTGINNSCGPTSALFVKNYFYIRQFKTSPSYVVDILSAIREVKVVYTQMGKAYNTTVLTDELKTLASVKWGWATAVKASGSNTISDNLLTMITRLKENYPVILSLKGSYPYNPVYPYAHIVIFYKYDGNTKRLYYFDPYYGRHNTFTSFSTDDIPNAVQGNLPYLRIAP